MIEPLSDDEKDEAGVLSLMNDHGKFAISVGYRGTLSFQKALERLMMREWIRLIDVSPLAAMPGEGVFRVFVASDEARRWFESAS